MSAALHSAYAEAVFFKCSKFYLQLPVNEQVTSKLCYKWNGIRKL